MIKSLKSSDKIVRPFKTFKTWKVQNIQHDDTLLLEQQDNEDPQDNVLIDSEECSLSIETQKFDIDLKYKFGKKIEGPFYPQGHKYHDSSKEPMNVDGTYYRTVYDSVKHLFYNDYNIQYDGNLLDLLGASTHNIKNPLKLFGVESSEYVDPSEVEDIDTGERYTGRPIERRVLSDVLTVVEVPRKMFGEKMKPNSIKMIDYSSEFEDISIVDDGYTNLITGEGTFNNIVKINFNEIRRIEAHREPGSKFDARDLHFGYKLASTGKYFLTGAPMSHDTMSESQSGSAFLYKYDSELRDFRLIRDFMCPFTQNGLSVEQRQDHNGLLTKQLGGILLDGEYSLNDNFGDAVELTSTFCAIGASQSHIRGKCEDDSTGHVFVYERNKGGLEHWGLLNIIEGLPNSEFGSSISIDGDFMAIGAPALNDGCGVVYVFRKEKRTTHHSWWRLSEVGDSYEYNPETGIREENPPRGSDESKEINETTTRWKIKSVVPDGNILEAFYCDDGVVGSIDSGSIDSGSIDSGSIDSGSIDSGSMASGSGECVTLNITEECDLDCGELLSTFGGLDIITQGVFPEDIENPKFDEGYRHHEYSDSPKYSHGDTTWVFDSYVMLGDGSAGKRFGEEVKLSNGNLYVSTPSSTDQICYIFKRNKDECGITWDTIYKISRSDHTTDIHDYTEHLRDSISPDFKNIDLDVRNNEIKVTIDPQRIEYDHWEWKLDSPLNKYSPISDLKASGTAVKDRLYDVIEVGPGRHEINVGFVDKNSHLVGKQSNLKFTINPTTSTITKRMSVVKYPFEYEYGIRHRFGHTIEVTDKLLIIGDVYDRTYTTGDNTYEAGSAYVYSLDGGVTFLKKIYGDFESETFFNNRFGESISIFGEDFIVGSPCTDASNIEISEDGTEIEVDDYYQGAGNNSESVYYQNGNKINAVQGSVFYYRVESADITLLKTINSNKRKLSVRRNYGYAVSLSPDFIYVGLPVLGNFPITELETFEGLGLKVMDTCDVLVANYEINEQMLHEQEMFLDGNVVAYDSGALMRGERSQVGNVFYKNGIIVLTSLNTYLSSVMQGSGKTGFQLEFKGTHTIYENEILCTVNPGEFNVSTNPTALVYEEIPYDVNGDGVFDEKDVRYIYKFLLGEDPGTIFVGDETEDVYGSIVLEQDTRWPNEDILLVESEDVLLSSLIDDWEVGDREATYEKILKNLNRLKDDGLLDIDLDGSSNSRDGKMLLRYFLGKTATGLIRGLINKQSQRRTPLEIKTFLDKMTGKENGQKISECFINYKKCDSLDKSGSYLAPYATTIGLYSGTDLVGVAKLGKAIKVVPNYPINFLIKFDG